MPNSVHSLAAGHSRLSSHHVLADHQPSVGAQNDAIDRHRTVRHTGADTLQRGERGNQLANDPKCEFRTARLLQRLR